MLLALAALMLGRGAKSSEASAALYNQANSLYARGDFAGAISLYEGAARAGIKNSDLYYNLGNAYYKSGDRGRAAAWWLRAERLNPRDPELKANLALASRQVNKALGLQPESRLMEFFRSLRDLAPARAWAALLSASIWGFWILLSLRMLSRRKKLNSLWSLLLVWSIILVMISGAGYLSRRHKETEPAAVVVARDVAAKSGPGEGFTPVFNLAPGARVLLRECRSEFCQVELPPGMVGWVQAQALEKI